MFVLVKMHAFLNFTILGMGLCDLNPASLLFEIKFLLKNLKFYRTNQCVPGRHKSKHWSEWASFEEYCNVLEYKAPLISIGTNFLQPSPDSKLTMMSVIFLYFECKSVKLFSKIIIIIFLTLGRYVPEGV